MYDPTAAEAQRQVLTTCLRCEPHVWPLCEKTHCFTVGSTAAKGDTSRVCYGSHRGCFFTHRTRDPLHRTRLDTISAGMVNNRGFFLKHHGANTMVHRAINRTKKLKTIIILIYIQIPGARDVLRLEPLPSFPWFQLSSTSSPSSLHFKSNRTYIHNKTLVSINKYEEKIKK
jgi:hypothetical protein